MLDAATREVTALSCSLPIRIPTSRTGCAGEEPMTPHAPAAQSFILRVWLERDDASSTDGEWRGELKHVPSGRSAYFRTLQGLPPVLRRLLEDPAPGDAGEGPEAAG